GLGMEPWTPTVEDGSAPPLPLVSPSPALHNLFDVYTVAIDDTNQLRSYGQRIDSVYVTIVTLILAGDAYVAASAKFDNWIPVIVTAGVGFVGIAFCQRWLRGMTNLNEILSQRYTWLRKLESMPELAELGANLFSSEYAAIYRPKEYEKVARRRNRQIQRIFRLIFLLIPLFLALATCVATNPWFQLHIEPLTLLR
ncbi:MAG: RipA family octameric membrane protein, partial [Ktedonobacterales bacterium]